MAYIVVAYIVMVHLGVVGRVAKDVVELELREVRVLGPVDLCADGAHDWQNMQISSSFLLQVSVFHLGQVAVPPIGRCYF